MASLLKFAPGNQSGMYFTVEREIRETEDEPTKIVPTDGYGLYQERACVHTGIQCLKASFGNIDIWVVFVLNFDAICCMHDDTTSHARLWDGPVQCVM